jgi:chaperonin GroES
MIKPLFDKVLIEVEKVENVTSSGIILSVETEKKLEKATVKAVGEDVTKLKKGDIIIFKDYNYDTIEIDDEEYSFIKEEDVLAKL